jgi:CBS domain-containing protein
MGAALGGLESMAFPDQGMGFWPLVSMGAILGGTMRSPLTGVIFAVELTHDFGAVLPLLIAVACAYGFTVLVLKRSILTEKISRRGFHVTREYATDPLEILFVREVMATNVSAIPVSVTREQIATAIGGRAERQRLFAVTGDGDELVGVVTRWALEEWAKGGTAAGGEALSLGSVVRKATIAQQDEPLRVVMNRMAETGLTELPVVEGESQSRLVGAITLEHMLKARARHVEEEQRRERVLPLHLILPRWLRPRRPREAKS